MAIFILVHGAGHGGWCWERVVPLLEARGHKVCAPDLPGLGKDQTPPANVQLADNVERISRLLDKMEEPVVLVGHARGIVGERVAGIDFHEVVEDHHLEDAQQVEARVVGMLG